MVKLIVAESLQSTRGSDGIAQRKGFKRSRSFFPSAYDASFLMVAIARIADDVQRSVGELEYAERLLSP